MKELCCLVNPAVKCTSCGWVKCWTHVRPEPFRPSKTHGTPQRRHDFEMITCRKGKVIRTGEPWRRTYGTVEDL